MDWCIPCDYNNKEINNSDTKKNELSVWVTCTLSFTYISLTFFLNYEKYYATFLCSSS